MPYFIKIQHIKLYVNIPNDVRNTHRIPAMTHSGVVQTPPVDKGSLVLPFTSVVDSDDAVNNKA